MTTCARPWPPGGVGSEQQRSSLGVHSGSSAAVSAGVQEEPRQQPQNHMHNAVDRFLTAPSASSGIRKTVSVPAAAMAAAAAARETALIGASSAAATASSRSSSSATNALSAGNRNTPTTSANSGTAPGENKISLIQQELPEEIDQETVQRLLEQADEIHVEAITASNMKRCVAQLEKRIKKNQQDRIRHADDPEKWVKSEVDLDEEIKRWKPLAADPELYSLFISSRGLELLLSLLNHSNVDIQLEVLDVLAEFTDADAVAECDEPQAVVDSLVEHQLLELTVEALLRINEEAGEDEHQGVAHCLSILENLLELQPSLAGRLARLQKFPTWLLRRVRHPLPSAAAAAAANASSGATGAGTSTTSAAAASALYDYNRIYASELLVILLQNSAAARETLGAKQSGDALDKLLRAVAVYRKKDPESSQEEEMVQNLFDALCSLLLAGDCMQGKFMCRLCESLQEAKSGATWTAARNRAHVAYCKREKALKVLDFALLRCEANCQLFVEKLGLKFLFSIFMKKTPPALQQKKRRKRSKAQEKQDEARLLNKFMEHQCEKIERLLELHDAYCPRLQTYLLKKAEGSDKQQSDSDNKDAEDDVVRRVTKEVTKRLVDLINMKSIELNQIKQVVTDYAAHMDASAAEEKKSLLELLQRFEQTHAAGGILDLPEDEDEDAEEEEEEEETK